MTAATTGMSADRTLPWDWYAGTVPANVQVSDQAYLETTFSFLKFRSQRPDAVEIGAGVSIYLGTMFDVGPARPRHLRRLLAVQRRAHRLRHRRSPSASTR